METAELEWLTTLKGNRLHAIRLGAAAALCGLSSSSWYSFYPARENATIKNCARCLNVAGLRCTKCPSKAVLRTNCVCYDPSAMWKWGVAKEHLTTFMKQRALAGQRDERINLLWETIYAFVDAQQRHNQLSDEQKREEIFANQLLRARRLLSNTIEEFVR